MTDTGREVFFLYPPSVLQDQLVQIVVRAEYEVYLLKDHRVVPSLLANYANAILFVNIDEKITDTTWEDFIKRVMADEKTANARIGILSYNTDPELAKRYLIDLSVPCGFIKLKLGLKESARILLTVLEVNEARGKRRYVRAPIPENAKVTFNIKTGRELVKGRIRDISAAGMACTFDRDDSVSQTDAIDDLQLNLRGVHVRVGGKIAGSRKTDNGTVYVVLFESLDSEIRGKLHAFIHATLQARMETRIAAFAR